jgi:hypothetical protein
MTNSWWEQLFIITNLPPNNFQFVAVPLYATGTKKFNGIGRVEYNWYPGSRGARAVVSVAGAKFTGGSFTDSLNNKNPLQFTKVVPSLKYVFANKKSVESCSKIHSMEDISYQ